MTTIQSDKPKILKPAILPDDVWLFYTVWAIEAGFLIWGLLANSSKIIAITILWACIFPGIAIFFHSIFYFTTKFLIFDDKFVFVSYNPFERFLQVSRRQEMAYEDVIYAYYLDKEIDFLEKFIGKMHQKRIPIEYGDFAGKNIDMNMLSEKFHISSQEIDGLVNETDESLGKVFLQSKLKLPKYINTENARQGWIGTARAKSYLVLSNKDGSKKMYIANLYDLSGADSQYFLKTLKQRNPNIKYLMNPNKFRRLFGSHKE
jgi:hypothetical protein